LAYKKIFAALGIVVVIAAIAFAFVRRAPAGEKPVIRIVQMLPLSGDMAVFGTVARDVSEMFLADWRAANPNAKYNYEIIYEDIQMSPAMAATAMRRLTSGGGRVDATFTVLSGAALAISPIAEEKKIIQVSWTSDPRTGVGEYNFRMVSDWNVAMRKLIAKLVADGHRKVAVVAAGDAGSQAFVPIFIEELGKQDVLRLAGSPHTVNPDERNFGILLQRIKSEGADSIVLQALSPISDIFITQARRANLGITITGYQSIGAIADKKITEGMWGYDDAKPDHEFSERVNAITGKQGTYYSEYVYAMLQVLVGAFELAGEEGRRPNPALVAKSMPLAARGTESPFGRLRALDDGTILLPEPTLQKIVGGKSITVKE